MFLPPFLPLPTLLLIHAKSHYFHLPHHHQVHVGGHHLFVTSDSSQFSLLDKLNKLHDQLINGCVLLGLVGSWSSLSSVKMGGDCWTPPTWPPAPTSPRHCGDAPPNYSRSTVKRSHRLLCQIRLHHCQSLSQMWHLQQTHPEWGWGGGRGGRGGSTGTATSSMTILASSWLWQWLCCQPH